MPIFIKCGVGRGEGEADNPEMGSVNIYKTVKAPFEAFQDRLDAGRVLSTFVPCSPGHHGIVLVVPRGGVPVGAPLAERLNAELELVFVRKLPIPTNPEMGFGLPLGSVLPSCVWVTAAVGIVVDGVTEGEICLRDGIKRASSST